MIPVSYARGPSRTLALARALSPRLVLGLGVAVSRERMEVESVGRSLLDPEVPDVDGVSLDGLGKPAEVASTLDVGRFAEAAAAGVSHDAGTYVCNAWLYRVAGALSVPVGFVHLPPEGVEIERLLAGIGALLIEPGGSVVG